MGRGLCASGSLLPERAPSVLSLVSVRSVNSLYDSAESGVSRPTWVKRINLAGFRKCFFERFVGISYICILSGIESHLWLLQARSIDDLR